VTSNRIWRQVDRVYGNNDGKVDVSDFDSFYGYAGYHDVGSDCSYQPGMTKVALFGTQGADGSWTPTHASIQSQKVHGMWESKEGTLKLSLHFLDDLIGDEYGDVIKCYARASS
jgi:hypothetical protein